MMGAERPKPKTSRGIARSMPPLCAAYLCRCHVLLRRPWWPITHVRAARVELPRSAPTSQG
eukprot:7392673-Pyramimonas_sp.AAC.1